MQNLEEYYLKFNEEKRLTRRHGQVEYITTMKYIHEVLNCFDSPKIIEIGAGTGRYSVSLAEEGYDVTAVELVKFNLGILKAKKSSVKAYQGNALDLSRFKNESFDVTLLLGPMYHLMDFQEKLKALNEAKRITKRNGILLVAYYMNEYAVLTHGFRDGHILESQANGKIDEDFHCRNQSEDLYDQVRIEDINKLNQAAGLERIKIFAADGPADYMRPVLNAMDEETFQLFLAYHLKTCERYELLGASSHTVDILKKVNKINNEIQEDSYERNDCI